MKNVKSALRYAKAVLNLAKEVKKETVLNDNMLLIANTIAESKDLETVLNSPVIKVANKNNALKAIFENQVDEIVLGLFDLLAENKRMEMLEDIAIQYTIIFEHYKSLQTAIVTTAVPLDEALEAKILEKVAQITGEKTTIENKVDPSILGGFMIRVGDIQYDASISNSFNELRKEFDNSHYIPKI